MNMAIMFYVKFSIFLIFAVYFCTNTAHSADLPSHYNEKKSSLTNDPQLANVANYAAKVISDTRNNPYLLKLTKIIKAESEVADDRVYFLRLEVASTNCSKAEYSQLSDECKVNYENGTVYICKVKAEIKDNNMDMIGIINPIKCKTKKKQKNTKVKNKKKVYGQMTGGLKNSELTDAIKEIGEFSVNEMNKKMNSKYLYCMGRIKSAQTQVVSGTMYHLSLYMGLTECPNDGTKKSCEECHFSENEKVKKCNVKVWEQVWLTPPRKLHQFECKPSSFSKLGKPRKPRDIMAQLEDKNDEAEEEQKIIDFLLKYYNDKIKPVPIELQAPNDLDVLKLANIAVQDYNQKSNHMFKHSSGKINNFLEEEIDGKIFDFMMYTTETECHNNNAKLTSDCPARKGGKVQLCNVTIWSENTKKIVQVIKINCEEGNEDDTKIEKILAGDKTSPEILNLADLAVQNYNAKSNNLFKHIVKSVKFLSGKKFFMRLFKVVMNVVETKCRNNNPKYTGASDCPVREKGKFQLCNATLWTKEDSNETHVFEFKCESRNRDKMFNKKKVPKEEMSNEIPESLPKKRKMNLLGADDHDYYHISLFKQFMLRFNKTYATAEEYSNRYKIFQENMKKARILQRNEQGTATYGATKFADLSEEEFKKYYLSPMWKYPKYPMKEAEIPKEDPPPEFDWRDHNVVTSVKDQGFCGSCWAFSTTGNIEGIWAVRKKQLISLSEQELVDCDKLDEGCNGGLPSNAYKEIIRLGGLESEKDYPYKGLDKKCIFNKTEVEVYINDSVAISKDENDMAKWLVKNGPISIGINANGMQLYLGGISHPWKFFCNPDHLDHGVLIVGYGTKKNKPYWIVKNSWGESWGIKGYYLVYRGDGTCGLNTMCTSAVIN